MVQTALQGLLIASSHGHGPKDLDPSLLLSHRGLGMHYSGPVGDPDSLGPV